MNYKSFNIGDWIGHISGVIEDESELDGNEMRDLVEFLSILKQKSCADAISRQAVDELSKELVHTTRDKADFLCNFWEGLQKLPSVTPKEKTGRWIKIQNGDGMFPQSIVCSKCNNENSHLDFNKHAEPIGKVFITSRYCPNCGAKMVGDKDGNSCGRN